ADATKAWEKAATDLQKFREKSKTYNFEVTVNNQTVNLADLDNQERQLLAQTDGLQAQIDKTRLNLAALKKIDTETQTVTSPQIKILKNQLADLENQWNASLTQFKPEFPAMRVLRERIEGVKKQIQNEPEFIVTKTAVDNREINDTQTDLRQKEAQ